MHKKYRIAPSLASTAPSLSQMCEYLAVMPRPVETGVEHDNRNLLALELFRQQHAGNVTRSTAHMMTIVAALDILKSQCPKRDLQ